MWSCSGRRVVFWTLNGRFLDVIPMLPSVAPLTALWRPTIGGRRAGQVFANFGQDSFIWDEANEQGFGFLVDPLPPYDNGMSYREDYEDGT